MTGSKQPIDDLLDGIDAYVHELLELAEAIGDLLRPGSGSMPESSADSAGDALEPEPTTWSTTAKVFPSITKRPLQLTTAGFRLVGAGPGIVIAPTSVSFLPAVLQPGEDSFTVTVERGKNGYGIYEGTVTAVSDPNTPVTDPVRPAW